MGIFAVIIGLMPGDLVVNDSTYTSPTSQDQAVVSYFNANNITLYQNTWTFTLSHGPAGQQVENQSGLPEGHRLQVRWGGFTNDPIQFRHAYPNWLLGWAGVLDYHYLYLLDKYKTILPNPGYYYNTVPYLYEADLLAVAGAGNTATLEMKCEHISVSFVVMPTNTSLTLAQAWDADNLTFLMSYEIDFDAMKPSAFSLIAQLVTFQSPEFGIPGDFGTIVTYVIAIGFWIVIAIIIYTLVTRVIPTIQGGLED